MLTGTLRKTSVENLRKRSSLGPVLIRPARRPELPSEPISNEKEPSLPSRVAAHAAMPGWQWPEPVCGAGRRSLYSSRRGHEALGCSVGVSDVERGGLHRSLPHG